MLTIDEKIRMYHKSLTVTPSMTGMYWSIILPQDVEELFGIQVWSVVDSAALAAMSANGGLAAHPFSGYFNLKMEHYNDVFYQVQVPVQNGSFDGDYAPLGISQPFPTPFQATDFISGGTSSDFHRVVVPHDTRYVLAYYEDFLLSALGAGSMAQLHLTIYYKKIR